MNTLTLIQQQQADGVTLPRPSVDLFFKPADIAAILGADLDHVTLFWPVIADVMDAHGILDKATAIAVLATIGVEVGSRFEPIPEYASGAEYEARADLGNTQPGDGVRFKGRGWIQITGRANYGTYGNRLGIDLISNPDLALDPAVAAEILVIYFMDHGIPYMAEIEDWQSVRRAVNGGTNGLAAFLTYVQALEAL